MRVLLTAAGISVPPPTPTLSYTADGQFTITNYNAALFYVVTGATRSSDILSSVSNGATITAAYANGAPTSGSSTMNVAPNVRILTSVAGGVSSEGCGPRPDLCCPAGTIQSTAGNQCGGAPGTRTPGGCGGGCPEGPFDPFNAGCFALFVTCWNWRWTNYSDGTDGIGYTLIGNTWGKVT